jgi:Fur family ferric uptake transcriptional regulator
MPKPATITVPAAVQERLLAHYRRLGMRRTDQRDTIIAAAFSSDEHFTADELWDRALALDPRTSRATVYRTIAMLVEAGLLREIELGGDQAHYDPNFLARPNHNHLVCVDCGRVIEFEDNHLDVLNECLTRRLGFRPSRTSLHIEGCCEQLRKTGRCQHLIESRLQGKRLHRKRR